MTAFFSNPYSDARLGDHLLAALQDGRWQHFEAAIAFVKHSGTKHIAPPLTTFSSNRKVRLFLGLDHLGSTVEGFCELLGAAPPPRGEVYVIHNRGASTFHPKTYLFYNADQALLIVGSGNMTEGGLYTNVETFLKMELQLSITHDKVIFDDVRRSFDSWTDAALGICQPLNLELIHHLHGLGVLPTENESQAMSGNRSRVADAQGGRADNLSDIFSRTPAPRAPSIPQERVRASPPSQRPYIFGGDVFRHELPAGVVSFAMTLQNTDVSVGQTSDETSRLSPEVFIPAVAVDSNAAFWGWPDLFEIDARWVAEHQDWIQNRSSTPRRGFEKRDRTVRVTFAGNQNPVELALWFNPLKVDFRLRGEMIRSAGLVDDILILTPTATPTTDFKVDIVRKGSEHYDGIRSRLTNTVTNSLKRWAYLQV